MARFAVGVDIGGTRTKLGLVDEGGRVLRESVFSSQGHGSPGHFVGALSQHIGELLEGEALSDGFLGIGIGAPNAYPDLGKMISPTNFVWDEVDVVAPLRGTWPGKILLENDACVAAIGEARWGKARGLSNFALVTLGTGVGLSLVAEGRMLRGPGGVNGEFGHSSLYEEGRECNCGGSRGHLEPYLSVEGMLKTIEEITGQSFQWSEVLELFSADPQSSLVSAALEQSARQLGRALASLHMLCGPELFVLSGGGSLLGSPFCQKVEQSLEEFTFPSFRGRARVTHSEISADQGAILGAAALIFSSSLV